MAELIEKKHGSVRDCQLDILQVRSVHSLLLTLLGTSFSDPDPVGSGFKLPDWIRIRIPDTDPESEIEL